MCMVNRYQFNRSPMDANRAVSLSFTLWLLLTRSLTHTLIILNFLSIRLYFFPLRFNCCMVSAMVFLDCSWLFVWGERWCEGSVIEPSFRKKPTCKQWCSESATTFIDNTHIHTHSQHEHLISTSTYKYIMSNEHSAYILYTSFCKGHERWLIFTHKSK